MAKADAVTAALAAHADAVTAALAASAASAATVSDQIGPYHFPDDTPAEHAAEAAREERYWFLSERLDNEDAVLAALAGDAQAIAAYHAASIVYDAALEADMLAGDAAVERARIREAISLADLPSLIHI